MGAMTNTVNRLTEKRYLAVPPDPNDGRGKLAELTPAGRAARNRAVNRLGQGLAPLAGTLAFSCKRRGFCPSCGARRMSQTAAHRVDHVIPHVPVRQWVLSLPIPLRVLLAAQPERVTSVLQVVHRVVTRHLLRRAGLKPEEGHGGAVTLIQRFGSAANLNIHLHCLVLDGV